TGDINTTSFTSSSQQGDGGNIAISTQTGDINTSNIDSGSSSDYGGNGGDITISAQTGDINTSNIDSHFDGYGNGDGGDITISTQSGDINTASIDSRFYSDGNGNGGNIIILTQSGDINTANIDSHFDGDDGDGDGGDITISTQSGDINTASIDSRFYSDGNGDGGDITISTQSGDINTANIDSSFYGDDGDGDGGDITISTQSGDINTGSISSSSNASSVNSGDGGAIYIEAEGDISTADINSSSVNSGNGGDISLNAQTIKFDFPEDGDTEQQAINTFSIGINNSGDGGNVNITTNNLSNTEIFTLSTHGKSGQVTIESQPQRNLQLNDSSILTSKQVTVKDSLGREIQIDVGAEQGQSGDVSIKSPGNINLNNVNIESDTKGKQRAGNVTIESQGGAITFNDSKILSTTNAKGNAGEITLKTPQDIQITNKSRLQADTQGKGNAGNINIEAGNLNLDENTSLTTETNAAGAPGKINIQANTIDIGENAQISATVTADSTNTTNTEEEKGKIDIFANTLNISGTLGIFAETAGEADAGTLTIKTYNDNPNLDINFSNQGFISASTSSTGNGGNISISAPETINITGNPETTNVIDGTIRVTTNNIGNAGEIQIETQNLTITDGISISASTTGVGDAGDIKINTNSFNLETGTSITTETNSTGAAGNIEINSPEVTIGENASISATALEGATNTEEEGGNISIFSNTLNISGELGIFAETQGEAPAGTLTLKPYNDNPDLDIIFSNSGFISARTTSTGDGGNIDITAPETIDITGDGKISVETTGEGKAGDINIDTQNLSLSGGVSISAETDSAGAAGNIEIKSPQLTIGENTQISATAKENSSNTEEGGGNIRIFSNELNISGELGIFAETKGEATAGTLTIQPYSDNPDLDITFSNSGFISARTFSSGNGGNIDITAPESINITGDGKISVETTGTGNAGEINIDTQNLTLSEGVNISAETNSGGAAGKIEIKSPTLTIGNNTSISATALEGATNTEEGAKISIFSNTLNISGELGIFAETQGEATAGTLTIKPYSDNPDLDITFSNNGFISARTFSSGNGGDINLLAPESINITGDGQITVETQGKGNAGEINIDTKNLTIAEGTTISAATSNDGTGGSININPTETFELNGQITTETTGAGNAGEINIETQNLTIAEGTTISAATSNEGDGGDININPTEKLELNGQIITETTSTGAGGNITINTGSLTAENSTISAQSTETAIGKAGSIEITAQSNITTGIITSSANNKTQAADGNHIIITSTEGEINATQPIQSFSEKGNAGDVTLNAQTNVTTNIISSHGQQKGGQINITAATGNIDTSNSTLANYSGRGDGGNVNLSAPQGDITTSNISSFADGNGGQINIKAGGEINLTENSNIISASEVATDSETDNPGKGGDIILEAGSNINTTTARIYSGANIGDTGKIEITADHTIETGQIDLASGFVRERLEFNDNNNFTLIPKPEGEATQGFAGDISIKSNNGTIDTTASTINSRSPDGSGKITIEALGNITTGKLEASALNTTKPTTGGDITITSQQGKITATQAIETFSEQGTAGSVNIDGAGHVEINTILSQGTQQGGDITIHSSSENSINVQDDLNTFSTEGTAGNITLTSPGTITIRGIRSEGLQQGGDVTIESGIGNIDATGGDIDSFSEQGIGGDVQLNASESVNLANVSSYGMTESGDLTIQSQTAEVNTENVTTEAPEGSSGSIIINGTEVGTGDLSSIGTTSAGEINVEATDGSIDTYDVEIRSDGTIGSLSLQATEDIETEDITQEAGEGD
ncbi:beta strand repeat-containing protein, partial [Dapis sp. BLCC M126]|uniref:beta strand repeat-containing protein n=1 Tax=Dapis sp. BLCC M126 TaxID=3400189 RepID=UPI003CF3D3C5